MCPLLSINDGTVMIEREYKIFYTEVENLEFELLESVEKNKKIECRKSQNPFFFSFYS